MDPNHLLALAGRVFIATIFLASAFAKITNFDGTTQFMTAHGLPAPALLCAAAILVELAGGLSLVLGYRARWGAVALIVFLVPTTLIFHRGGGGADQRIHLLKNLAILGGLMMVAAFGPGEASLDEKA